MAFSGLITRKITVSEVNGNTVVIDSVGYNKPLLIIFFHTYNCISCIDSLRLVISSLESKKIEFDYFVLARTRVPRDLIEAFQLKKEIRKIFPSAIVYFDIHQKHDKWPPTNLKDGLFGKYRLKLFPSVLILNKKKEILLTFEELFPDNYTVETINKKILSALKKTSK